MIYCVAHCGSELFCQGQWDCFVQWSLQYSVKQYISDVCLLIIYQEIPKIQIRVTKIRRSWWLSKWPALTSPVMGVRCRIEEFTCQLKCGPWSYIQNHVTKGMFFRSKGSWFCKKKKNWNITATTWSQCDTGICEKHWCCSAEECTGCLQILCSCYMRILWILWLCVLCIHFIVSWWCGVSEQTWGVLSCEEFLTVHGCKLLNCAVSKKPDSWISLNSLSFTIIWELSNHTVSQYNNTAPWLSRRPTWHIASSSFYLF